MGVPPHARGAGDKSRKWNETAQTELEKIQTALNEVAESLRVKPAPC